ncbi:S-adenosyl-L-methionine-dependent methyltransferase [Viridothelium virens]|uniref:S-adenosyl-L-methionine-dependent methyltransferase n=1 Tax=Viridothelium virens TaxID=1048519 RepID=A0A6A6H2P9_VIRVR|nr:S-adenosyl-L-methionine-dependent methyltransferase [Viridothelium virens]
MASHIEPDYKLRNVDFPKYFSQLSKIYDRQTGGTTRTNFAQLLPHIDPPIISSSIIHDNASGPGTASSVILTQANSQPPKISGTDSVPDMITAFRDNITKNSWTTVTASVMDSHHLQFPENTFTHSITNFSIFTFKDDVEAMKEVYRTLQPNGVAVVTTWKHFGVTGIIHTVQRAIRPDLPLMQQPNSGRFVMDSDTYLRLVMAKAGFEEAKMELVQKDLFANGEAADGVVEFMSGGFFEKAREGYTEEEKGKWEGEVRKAVERETEDYGGLRMHMWAVLARK